MLDGLRRGTYHQDRIDKIINTAMAMGIDGQDVDQLGTVYKAHRSWRYGFQVKPRALRPFKALTEEITHVLNSQPVRIVQESGLVFVEVPRDDPETLTYQATLALDPNLAYGEMLLGVTADGQQLTVFLPSPDAVHLLITSTTGSGKTTLLKVMVASGLYSGAKVALFDPVGNLASLSGHSRVWRRGLFRTQEEIACGLGALTRRIGRARDPHDWVFAVIDEAPHLCGNTMIKNAMTTLAQVGRNAGVHLIVSSQLSRVSDLGSDLVRNLPLRITGRVTDAHAAYNATGRRGTGAELLGGLGDFVLVHGVSPIRFQAPLFSSQDEARFMRQFPPTSGHRLPMVAAPAPQSVAITDPGVRGRPMEGPDPRVVAAVRAFISNNGKPPSLNWVSDQYQQVAGQGCGRDKAQRTIEGA